MGEHLRNLIRTIFNLQEGTDVRGTIDSIRANTELRGYNVWILACGAILASIGLDTNSPAIIIGAMLISPLMGPILGIGLSVGINDRENLIEALESFSVAVVASLLMSSLYFLATPLGEVTPEMLARTQPTLLDAGVAFFGGIAGIVAGSRKEKTNAIPGVAIATALMPPLCTAGFGLARGSWDIFLGAFYLFFLNSAFIALSTYLIVRFLKFPLMDYQDPESRKRVTRWILFFSILVILPSVFFLIQIIQDIRLRQSVERFITNRVNNDDHMVINHEFIRGDSVHTLKLYMTGTYIEDSERDSLIDLLPPNLKNCEVKFTQNMPPLREDQVTNKVKLEVLQAIEFKKEQIDENQRRLDSLTQELAIMASDSFPVGEILAELLNYHPHILRFSLSKTVEIGKDTKRDTLPLVTLQWDRVLSYQKRQAEENQIQQFLIQRLDLDTLKIIGYR